MADLQRKSYNLFDKNATDTSNGYEADHYLNSVGESGESGNHYISEYIDISGYSAITLVGDSIVGSNITNTFYNANKEKISYFYTDTRPYTTTVPNNAKYIRLTIAKSRANEIMLISGSTPKPYEAYGAWVHSLRKLTTATEAVENPLYSDGTAITSYTIKGNTVQNGTPTPSNPVAVNGVGDMSSNLLDSGSTTYTVLNVTITANNGYYTLNGQSSSGGGRNYHASKDIMLDSGTYVMKLIGTAEGVTPYIQNGTTIIGYNKYAFTLNEPTSVYLGFNFDNSKPYFDNVSFGVMLIQSSTAPTTFEPYGYKIPISSGGVTTPMYLTEPLMKKGTVVDDLSSSGTVTYNIKKMVLNGSEDWQIEMTDNFYISTPFSGNTGRATVLCTHQVSTSSSYVTGENCFISPSGRFNFTTSAITHTVNDFKTWVQQQYAASTPVTVWYVMETPTTESVTAPPIPTTEGANTITVDTTVQPSEFTATWTGWHNAYVKEKSANLWNEDYTGISGTMKYNAIYVGEGEFTLSSNIVNNNYSYIFFLAGRVASGASTGTNDVYNGQSRTVTAVNGYVTIAFRSTASYSPESYNTMLNSGSTAQTYEPYWK